jgi:hypothetical protein
MFFPKNNDKGIMSLAVVFVIGFFGLGLVLTVATAALLGINKNYNTNSGNQTFYTAEAAAREGVYQYLASSSYLGGNFNQPINNISTSSIPISVSSSWPYVTITAEAEDNTTHREVGYILNVFPEGLAFDYAIYAENDLNFQSAGAEVNGNVFANSSTSDSVTCNPNADINGDVSSPGTIDEDCNSAASSTVENVEPIPFPPIDLDAYASLATCFATTAADALACVPNAPLSGVIFASTTDFINNLGGNNTDLLGSIITKDGMKINNGTYTTAYATSVVIATEGDLTLRGNTTITGIVYVKGSTELGGGGGSNNVTINGALISLGGVTNISGNVEINYNEDIVGEWADLLGLATSTPALPPRITQWQEQ